MLKEFLYLAVYVAPGDPIPLRSVTETQEMRAYVEGFRRAGDVAVCAEDEGERLSRLRGSALGRGHEAAGAPDSGKARLGRKGWGSVC